MSTVAPIEAILLHFINKDEAFTITSWETQNRECLGLSLSVSAFELFP